MTRALSVVMVSLCSACGTAAAPPPPSAAAHATTIETAPAAPTTTLGVDPCVAGREQTAAAVAHARAASDLPADSWEVGALDAFAAQLGETCTRAGANAWIVLLADAALPVAGSTTITTRSRVAFVTRYGLVYRADDSIAIELDAEMNGAGTIRFERVFDWSGDGTPEVVVRVEEHFFEEGSTTLSHFTYANEAVTPYAPLANVVPQQIVDEDADGRPDVVAIWTGWSGSACGSDPPVEGTPAVLYHSLADGTFSTSDDVAASFLRRACPAAPERLLGSDWPCGEQDARRTIACARAWGASADVVRTRLATEREGLSTTARGLGDWSGLDAYAAADPPLTLH